jgi:hypothetical protein
MVPRSNKGCDFPAAPPARRTDFGKWKYVHQFQKSASCLLSQFEPRFVLHLIAPHFSRCRGWPGRPRRRVTREGRSTMNAAVKQAAAPTSGPHVGLYPGDGHDKKTATCEGGNRLPRVRSAFRGRHGVLFSFLRERPAPRGVGPPGNLERNNADIR